MGKDDNGYTASGALEGTGKPEVLKHQHGYSRQIDDANRLVYEIDEIGNIKIIICQEEYAAGLQTNT